MTDAFSAPTINIVTNFLTYLEEMLYRSSRRVSDVSRSMSDSRSNNNNNDDDDEVVQQVFDPTGMHYWRPPRSLDEVVLVSLYINSVYQHQVILLRL